MARSGTGCSPSAADRRAPCAALAVPAARGGGVESLALRLCRRVVRPVLRTRRARLLEQRHRLVPLSAQQRCLAEIECHRAALVLLCLGVRVHRERTEAVRAEHAEEIARHGRRPVDRVREREVGDEIGRVVLLESLPRQVQPDHDVGVRRIETEPALQIGRRLREVAEVEVGAAAVLDREGVIGLEGDGTVEVLDGSRQVVHPGVCDAAIVVESCVAGRQQNRLVVVCQSPLEVSLVLVGETTILPGDDEPGLERDRPVEVADRAVELSLLEVRDPRRGERARVARRCVAGTHPGESHPDSEKARQYTALHCGLVKFGTASGSPSGRRTRSPLWMTQKALKSLLQERRRRPPVLNTPRLTAWPVHNTTRS